MTDYAAKADRALSMLTRYGQDVTRTAVTEGAYNTSTGSLNTRVTLTWSDYFFGGFDAGNAESASPRKGAIFPFSTGATTIRGEKVRVEDQEMYLDAEGPVLQSDRYIVNGKAYTVVSFDEISPAGTPVLYTIHLRRA